MHQPYPVKLNPILQQRIWGGNRLKQLFHMSHIEEPIGEYWVLSGHPHGTSTVINGWLAGKSLIDLIQLFPKEYLGHSPQPRFPLLIKFLEAEADLSVQIHPDDTYALKNEGDYGKAEAWYIVDCKQEGRVNRGHRFASREEFKSAIENHRVKDYLCYQKIKKDEVVYVPASTLHALLAGTIVIEIQQTSDVTYRVYDWDRVDKNGKPRELHIDRATDVMQYSASQSNDAILTEVLVETDKLKHERLLQCPYFTLDKLLITSDAVSLARGGIYSPDIVIMASGSAKLRWKSGEIDLEIGDTVLVPANINHYEIVPKGAIKILRTFY